MATKIGRVKFSKFITANSPDEVCEVTASGAVWGRLVLPWIKYTTFKERTIMNALNKGQREVKKSLDTTWMDNLEKLEGPRGLQSTIPNDNKDLFSRLIKALADRDALPRDLDNPETTTEVEAVDEFATTLYELFCEGAEKSEAMMVGAQVEKAYEDIMDESGNTRDMYAETGHTRADF